MQIRHDDMGKRFSPQQTLFSMPECCLFADLIDLLEKDAQPSEQYIFCLEKSKLLTILN